MKELCFYRDNSYFNGNDYFLIYDLPLKRFHLNLCERNGGTYYSAYRKIMNFNYKFWYNGGPLQYKMSTIPCINHKELIGLKVRYKGTELTGTIAEHVVLNGMGIHWDKHLASDYRKWGFPYFWNNPNHLEILP